jgi:ribosome assembly protein 1
VYGLEDVQLKTATLSSSAYCQPLCGFAQGIRPLVKVSIEPEVTSDAEYLERGLTKLSLADAGVEVSSTAKGERLLACLGELHLEQSILDLERVYCGKVEGIKLRVSDPIVEFAESTTWFSKQEIENFTGFFDDASPILRQATIPPYSEEEGIAYARNGRMRVVFSGRGAALSLRVVPLPSSVYKCLETDEISSVENECHEELLGLGSALQCSASTPEAILHELKQSLLSLNSNECGMICTIGIRDGTTVRGVVAAEVYYPVTLTKQDNQEVSDEDTLAIQNKIELGVKEFESLRSDIRKGGFSALTDAESQSEDFNAAAFSIWLKSMKGSVAAGFETAMSAGPICEEPVRNVLVVLEGVEVAVVKQSDSDSYHASKPIAAGMMVSSLRVGTRCALLSRPVRLMEGHLRLTLHSSLAGLGSLYQVLSKRRGKVIEDSMVDGTDLLMITALIPQAEAFGLTPELFAKTSGEVTAPEMLFSHWECLDVDPFWIPTSEEEREDFGELQTAGDASTGLDNTALSYIRRVRKRKGLTVDSSRTVLSAEKQRTLKR